MVAIWPSWKFGRAHYSIYCGITIDQISNGKSGKKFVE